MKLVCTADWHLRKSVPICRKETESEWFDFQFSIIENILDITKKQNANLVIAGDIFDRAVPGQKIINTLLKLFHKYNSIEKFIIAGNHDLPYHNFQLINESGYGTIIQGKTISHNDLITEHHFNTEIKEHASIVLCHHLCFENEKSIPPHINAITAKDLIKMYLKANIIICGDNHHGFIKNFKDKIIIVPGSITIQSVTEFNITPSVYLLEIENKKCIDHKQIKLKNPIEMLTDTHIKKQQQRNEHIDNFINLLKNKRKMSLSFIDNINAILNNKNIEQSVKDIIIELKEII